MNELIEYCCDELDELKSKIKKGGKLSMAETEYMDTLAHAKKNLLAGEEMSEEGYSGMMYPRYYGDDGSYADGRSRNGGRSYARGRGRNARRDSMGRYSRGYSMAADDMVEELRDLMEDAPDEKTRMEFEKFIRKVESM